MLIFPVLGMNLKTSLFEGTNPVLFWSVICSLVGGQFLLVGGGYSFLINRGFLYAAGAAAASGDSGGAGDHDFAAGAYGTAGDGAPDTGTRPSQKIALKIESERDALAAEVAKLRRQLREKDQHIAALSTNSTGVV